MIYSVKASTDPELKFELSDEPFCNGDGSEIGWATDWPHLKRKLGTEKTAGLDDETSTIPKGSGSARLSRRGTMLTIPR